MVGRKLSHYEITGKLGAGGMGEVFRARDTKLGREVAVKVLPDEFASDAERLSRFRREASLLASLNHPNIATLHGLDDADGVHFLVMELVEGEELADVIQRGPVPVTEALRIAAQVAAGLEAAHEQGIIHRDLKPRNIRVTPDGTVKVLDFGLAKSFENAAGSQDISQSPTVMSSGQTVEGVILGTAAYMSPEQARGKPVDRRTDVWSFGCVVFEMLTGRIAFEGETVTDTLAKILEREPDWDSLPAAVTPALRYVLEKCLAKDANERWRSVGDVSMMMSRTAESRGMTAGATPAAPPAKRNRWLWPVITGVLLVALAWSLATRGGGGGLANEVSGAAAVVTNMKFDRLTVQGGVESYPAISPDNTFIVYQAEDGDDLDIFYQRVGGFRPINLTENSAATDEWPAISPDGDRIAFVSDRGEGGVFLMGATGESVRRIHGDGAHPCWSPDGEHIVISTAGFVNPLGRGIKGKLWIIDPDGGDAQQLTTSGDAVQPDWSPNGHRIAFWGIQDTTGGQRDVWTVGVDRGDVVPVTLDPPVDWSPVWSADGRHLYFLSNRAGTFSIWRVPIDERTGKVLGDFEAVTTPAHWVDAFDISADGRRLVYPGLVFTSNISRIELDLTGSTPPREAPVTRGLVPIIDFDVTRDGQWITYRSGGNREDINLARGDGTGARKLTDDVARDRGTRFSWDGNTIYFYSDRSGRYEFWSIRTDGSGLTRLTETPAGESWWYPAPSPDGTRILGISDKGSIILPASGFPVDMGTAERLPPLEGVDHTRMLEWSPDGKRLLGQPFDAYELPMDGILVYDLETQSYRRFAESRGSVNQNAIAFLSDGRRVLAVIQGEMVLVDTTDGSIRELFETGEGVYQLRLVDDTNAYTIRQHTEGDIWMATLEQ